MAVVAGLFDSDLEATQAMDKLLREHIEDMDTQVIEPGRRTSAEPGVIVPLIPNTSGGQSGTGMGVPLAGAALNWMSDMDDVERSFYSEGLREGSTLALAKVKDEDAARVRELMSSFGARTYVKK